ncbi:MAG: hypothetical protein ACK5B6_00685 [Bacteroidia bacterium]|jgi:hypothetical protein
MNSIKYFILWIEQLILGAIANSIVLQLGLSLVKLPDGVSFNSPESLSASMSLLEPKHFIAPFAAHSIGTLVSAILLTWVLELNSPKSALVASFLFFSGGCYMVFILPAPLWFNIVDLTLAYFPMGLLGYWIGRKILENSAKPIPHERLS